MNLDGLLHTFMGFFFRMSVIKVHCNNNIMILLKVWGARSDNLWWGRYTLEMVT